MKLATTTGDLLYYCETPAEAVRAFEGTGFKHLDFSFWRMAWGKRPLLADNWMEPIIAAGKEAERLGFDFVQAHSPGVNIFDKTADYEETLLANIRSIEACGYLGAKKIVVHSGYCGDYKYPQDKERYFEVNRRFYERLFPAMEKYGVKVLIENGFAYEGANYFPTHGQELAELIDFCGHPLLGACWDTGHGNIPHQTAYDQLTALGHRLEGLHVQDNYGETDNHLAPYMGSLDLDSLMNGLQDCGYLGREDCYFTFECDALLKQDRRKDERFAQRANITPIDLKRKAVGLMYEIGKHILTTYGCYEG